MIKKLNNKTKKINKMGQSIKKRIGKRNRKNRTNQLSQIKLVEKNNALIKKIKSE